MVEKWFGQNKKTIAQYPEAQLVALKGQNSGEVGAEGLKRDFVSETTQKWLRMSIMDLGLEKKTKSGRQGPQIFNLKSRIAKF
jgi:hypothetical protein